MDIDPLAGPSREIILADGRRCVVPENIRRVDDSQLHGWQIRYGEWTDFPDCGADGAAPALAAAIELLRIRLNTLGK